ncbi:MAG: hypothetical protein ACE14M_08895 [Terriglobales bacterium]
MVASSPVHVKDAAPASQRAAIPLFAIVLLALAIHAPLLMMELPNNSYDANFHMFFASHYAQHWFNPWNEKWFTGFSQTTYPPLQHQWIAIFSKLMSLDMAYMLVQLIAILLMPIGMYRYARLWVDERTASYAAIGSVLLGSLSFLVYQSGQLSTTMAAPLYLNALPYFYDWLTKTRVRALIKGVVLCLAAAAAHHVTLLFGAVLFALPVLWLAMIDRKREGASVGGVVSRAAVFVAISTVGVGAVLLPYFVALIHNPIKQMPIPHASRANFLLEPIWGVNFFIIPYGALLLALPYIFWRGCTENRLRPLFFGFWLTFLLGLGGTTPIPRLLLGRAFEVLTFERFAFWATLMALPIASILAVKIIDRFHTKGVVAVSLLAVLSCGAALGWAVAWRPFAPQRFDVQPVISFLNRDNHDRFRYLTLGFGGLMSKVGAFANASSVDGEYNSARLLPEMTRYGSAQLTNSKYYGTSGMESLRAMLKHANKYGLKYIFVHDRYYEPLLAFAGWRPTEVYDSGQITLWTKEDVPPARPMEFGDVPPPWQGLMWGILPIGSSILAIIVVLLLPERKRLAEPLEFPAAPGETVYVREAK